MVGTLLGLDLGTSACKAVLLAEDGRVIGIGSAEYPVHQPAPTWAEQDPALWWRGAREAIQQALGAAGVEGRDVRGVGLTGQMHGMVALDADLEVIRPAIIWSDQRSAPQAEDLVRRVGTARVVEMVANPPLPNFTATKLLWMAEHEPALYRRIRHVLLPKDYVRLRLTSELGTDVSDASGTLCFDVTARRWSRPACELLGIDPAWWPEASESAQVTGAVSRTGAAQTGLAEGTPVVAGAGDQAASAVGSGIVRSGLVSVTIGTSGVVFAATDRVIRDPQGRLHTFCHAVPEMWHVMGVTQSAGGALAWWKTAFAEGQSYDDLMLAAEAIPPGAEGVIFLPYLMGERTPHTDPRARGVFFGLTPRHSAAHCTRAVLEGVSQSMRDCLDLIEEIGCPVHEIRMTGGGAKSPLWRQIQADVFARPVRAVGSSEGPASGAALLAAVGTGVFDSVAQACQAALTAGAETRPAPDAVAAYIEQGEIYRALYRALRPVFAQAAGS